MGVRLYDSLLANGHIREKAEEVALTDAGTDFMRELGIEIESLDQARRPLCRSCLDWSARRTHLSGSLGVALLDRIYFLRWAKRAEGSRAVTFSPQGEQKFLEAFRL